VGNNHVRNMSVFRGFPAREGRSPFKGIFADMIVSAENSVDMKIPVIKFSPERGDRGSESRH
jgi:hypothetical protein